MAAIQTAMTGSSTGLTSRAIIRPAYQHPSILVFAPRQAVANKACNSVTVRASSSVPETQQDGDVNRRDLIVSTAVLLAAGPMFAGDALAGKAPKGFAGHQDSIDKYAFIFPFGWQEVAVKGQDIVFKDVIEPLESVSVNIIKTDKESLAELGPPDEVVKTLVDKVLTSPTQKVALVSAQERETEGKKYYTFEFVAKASNYTRHALGTIAVANGKFYTITTGSSERRWPKMEEKLKTIVDSFVLL